MGEEYDTAELAALSAGEAYYAKSRVTDTEYMGAIIRHSEGHYYYTVTKGKRGKHTVTAKIIKPKSHELVAFWHTHGNHDTGEFFSVVDVKLSEKTNLPFYLMTPKGKLKKVMPGTPLKGAKRCRNTMCIKGVSV